MESPNRPAVIPAGSATEPGKRAGALVAAPVDRLPVYVTAAEARAIINAAEGFRDRLLLETIWQTGGRISEVLRIRPTDVDALLGTIQLANLKQRRARARKVVYVSVDLAAQLRALARDLRIPVDGYLFQSRQSAGKPMSRYQAYRIISDAARAAQVYKESPRIGWAPAWPHCFRHGAAVHLLQQTLRLDYVQDQLGHSRLETTKQYLRLSDADKQRLRDQVRY